MLGISKDDEGLGGLVARKIFFFPFHYLWYADLC